MRIDVLTLFPEMFAAPLSTSVLGRAVAEGSLKVNLVNFRDFASGRHRVVDDYPFGGGAGMVLKPEPLFSAVESLLADGLDAGRQADVRIILMSPQGRRLTDQVVRELAREPRLILICGHYEGYDERIREHLANDEISIGDYVLTGGELPALVIIDSVARMLPGVLGNGDSAKEDSFAQGLLEYPQYTRPSEFRGWPVPEVLLSGHHAQIAVWRRRQALRRTWLRRPDLLQTARLDEEDIEYLRLLGADI